MSISPSVQLVLEDIEARISILRPEERDWIRQKVYAKTRNLKLSSSPAVETSKSSVEASLKAPQSSVELLIEKNEEFEVGYSRDNVIPQSMSLSLVIPKRIPLQDQEANADETVAEFSPAVAPITQTILGSPRGRRLRRIVDLMRDPIKGLDISDRQYRLKTYRRCFVGEEAVSWLVKNFPSYCGIELPGNSISSIQQSSSSSSGSSPSPRSSWKVREARINAEIIGQVLQERGLFSHVAVEHPFRDAPLYYRFIISPRIVIVGGGFLGSAVALKLLQLNQSQTLEILLLDGRGIFECTPSIPFLLGDPSHISSLRADHDCYLKGEQIRTRHAAVEWIHPTKNILMTKGGIVIPFDALVIASGCACRIPSTLLPESGSPKKPSSTFTSVSDQQPSLSLNIPLSQSSTSAIGTSPPTAASASASARRARSISNNIENSTPVTRMTSFDEEMKIPQIVTTSAPVAVPSEPFGGREEPNTPIHRLQRKHENIWNPTKAEDMLAAAGWMKQNPNSPIVVVGSGAVGIEVLGEIVCMSNKNRPIAMVTSSARLLVRNSAAAGNYCETYLKLQSPKLRFFYNQRAMRYDGKYLTLQSGEMIPCEGLFPCVGYIPNSHFMNKYMADALDKDKYICVSTTCNVVKGPKCTLDDYRSIKLKDQEGNLVEVWPHIFSGGDVCNFPEEKLAQNADRHAEVIAYNIKTLFVKGKSEPFQLANYAPAQRVMIISLGPKEAVTVYGDSVSVKGSVSRLLKNLVEYKIMRGIQC